MSYLDGMSEAERDELEGQVFEQRMRDTAGGYDWGDPIVLWTWPRRPRFAFSEAQLRVAERAAGAA